MVYPNAKVAMMILLGLNSVSTWLTIVLEKGKGEETRWQAFFSVFVVQTDATFRDEQ